MSNPPRQWLPHERPMMPGSPSTPLHAPPLRVAYLLIGILVSLTGGLGNALVSAHLLNLQGALGVYAAEAAWLPAAYVMTNVSMNLLLVKFRQQFGLRLFTEIFLGLYALIAFAHLFVNDLSSAIAVRAAHGMSGAALSSLGLYYMLQAFPAKHRMKGLVLALGITQVATPLAYTMPTTLLEVAEWRGLYMFEFGLALTALGCVLWLKLPPGDRFNTFEKLDFLTFGLFAPGMALLVATIALGRTAWWLESRWIGMALVGSIVLLTTAFLIEHYRKNPLLNTRWLSSGAMLRFFLVMMLVRIVLSEQGIGLVAFMQSLGMGSDQLRIVFAYVLLGTLAGTVVCALIVTPQRVDAIIAFALVCMIAGALMDADSTNLKRPADMLLSQFLLAFGGGMFLAPAIIAVLGSIISQPKNLVGFAVLFGISQNLGGLIGSAAVGTFQIVREKFHSNVLTEQMTLLDPDVAARIQSGASAYGKVMTDAVLRNAGGSAALQTAITREANVLAYNEVFLLVAAVAALTLLFVVGHALRVKFRTPPAAVAPAATPPSPPSPPSPPPPESRRIDTTPLSDTV
jgi:MFS family permease